MQLEQAKAQLDSTRAEHAETESRLRNSKKKAGGEVEAALTTFDTEVGTKHS